MHGRKKEGKYSTGKRMNAWMNDSNMDCPSQTTTTMQVRERSMDKLTTDNNVSRSAKAQVPTQKRCNNLHKMTMTTITGFNNYGLHNRKKNKIITKIVIDEWKENENCITSMIIVDVSVV